MVHPGKFITQTCWEVHNNFGSYIDWFLSNYNLSQREAEQGVRDMRIEFKTELITRGLSDDEIENWSEEKWKIGVK